MILSRKNSIHASHWGDELSLLFCTAWHFCLNSNHLNVNGNYKACLVVYISTVSKPKLVFWWKKWHIISCLKGYFKSTLKKKTNSTFVFSFCVDRENPALYSKMLTIRNLLNYINIQGVKSCWNKTKLIFIRQLCHIGHHKCYKHDNGSITVNKFKTNDIM